MDDLQFYPIFPLEFSHYSSSYMFTKVFMYPETIFIGHIVPEVPELRLAPIAVPIEDETSYADFISHEDLHILSSRLLLEDGFDTNQVFRAQYWMDWFCKSETLESSGWATEFFQSSRYVQFSLQKKARVLGVFGTLGMGKSLEMVWDTYQRQRGETDI